MSFSRFPIASLFTPHTRDVFNLLDKLATTIPAAATNAYHRAFSPNFDVHETPHAYILEGELPGIEDKSKIDMEFTDSQTLLVRGKIEKSYDQTFGGDQPEQKQAEGAAETKKESQEITNIGSPETAVLKAESGAPGTKFWVSERTIGEFQRSFQFPSSIDIDKVQASLDHGILKVVVPKKEQGKGRKIEIH
ncbi:hypothetical protein RUND412_002292 [Rhizina undulata]